MPSRCGRKHGKGVAAQDGGANHMAPRRDRLGQRGIIARQQAVRLDEMQPALAKRRLGNRLGDRDAGGLQFGQQGGGADGAAALDRKPAAVLAGALGLDARDLAAKPMFTARLKHHVPYSLHGYFTPRLF